MASESAADRGLILVDDLTVTAVVVSGMDLLAARLARRGGLEPQELEFRDRLLALHLAQARAEFEAAVPPRSVAPVALGAVARAALDEGGEP